MKFSRHLHAADIQDLLNETGTRILEYFPQTRLYHLALPPGRDTLSAIENLKNRHGVLLAAPNYRVSAQLLPNDPQFSLAWGLHNTGQTGGVAGADIGVAGVWDSFQDGSGVLVAVIDTGIDYDHPDLAANMWVNPGEVAGNGVDDDGNGFIDDVHGYDFANDDGDPMDDNEHGTHVAGTLGAVGNNGSGVSGVAWNAQIMAVKFLDESTNGSLSLAVASIEYAIANGAKILNNSWGGGGFNAALLNAILESDAQGALFFAAAGNQGRDTDSNEFYPAGYDSPNILSIASIEDNDSLSFFSNFGKLSVDFAAPGGEVYSTKPGNTYGYISGTSMATPHAAGAAALLWTQFPSLNHRQIRNLLFQGVAHRNYLETLTVMEGILSVANSLAVATDPGNQAPVANAGSDQNRNLGNKVTLNGSATDPDGDFPLIFEWELTVPPGSDSTLKSPVSQKPNFTPDMVGIYTATLVVSDSLASSVPDSVTININGGSLPPPTVVIHASFRLEGGAIQALDSGAPAPTGSEVNLDGSDSTSLFPDQMLFEWLVVAKPPDSAAQLVHAAQSMAQLTPDKPGTYTVRLTVEDGHNENFGEISFLAADPAPPPPPPPASIPEDPAPPAPVAAAAGGCSLIIRE